MSREDQSYSEKRNFIRMNIPAGTEVTLKFDEKTLKGECINLSGSGLLVATREKLPEDVTLLAEVGSHYGHAPTLSARARVVRSETTNQQTWESGLEILEIID